MQDLLDDLAGEIQRLRVADTVDVHEERAARIRASCSRIQVLLEQTRVHALQRRPQDVKEKEKEP